MEEPDELTQLRKENAELKLSIKKWKDSWFKLRESLGRLWWHHPAIDDDAQREYFKNNLAQIKVRNDIQRG